MNTSKYGASVVYTSYGCRYSTTYIYCVNTIPQIQINFSTMWYIQNHTRLQWHLTLILHTPLGTCPFSPPLLHTCLNHHHCMYHLHTTNTISASQLSHHTYNTLTHTPYLLYITIGTHEYHSIQWNLSTEDTTGIQLAVLYTVGPLYRGHHRDPAGCPVYSGNSL